MNKLPLFLALSALSLSLCACNRSDNAPPSKRNPDCKCNWECPCNPGCGCSKGDKCECS